MKKTLSLILSIIIIAGAMPISAYAFSKNAADNSYVEITNSPEEEIEYEETLFAPVTVEDNKVTQNGEEIESVTKNGELFVDASEFTDPNNLPETVDFFEKDDSIYASLNDLDEACDLEKDTINGKIVYSKPYQTKRLIAYGKPVPKTNEIKRETLFDGGILLTFNSEEETEKAYKALKDTETVDSVETENIYNMSEFTEKDFPLGENLSWGTDYIGSPYLVEYENSNIKDKEVTVAVIDTGINQKHSFLKNRIDERSKSFVEEEATVEDGNGHGSHVAGIITDNTPDNVKILAVKGLDKDGYGSDVDIAKAINYAAEQGANIISMSFGGFDFFTATVLKNAVNSAYNKGITLVAAAGNESDDAEYFYPANSKSCITVAAVKKDGSPAGYSNYGDDVDIAAPGSNINSTVNATSSSSDTYETYSGTSMATPFVSAACADAVLLDKVKSPSELKTFVKNKVTKINYSGNKNYGSGIINLLNYTAFEKCDPVIFDTANGCYTDKMEVTMSTATDGASIYYTTDGTMPDKSANLYTGAVTVSEDTQIKAVAMKDGIAKSPYTKASYRFSDYDFESNYIIDENGYITAYLGSAEKLAVQNVIAGKEIIGISDNVFKGSSINSIVLPDKVQQLGNYAFYNCKNLKEIIAKGVKYVGDYCFWWDTFTNFTLGALESAGQYAFYLCGHINDECVDISNLTVVEPYAFYRCRFNEIKSDKITKVGKYAFWGNWGCVNIELPNAEIIDTYAFHSCNKVEYIKLESVTQLGGSAFSDINELKKVYCPKLRILGSYAFGGCSKLETIDLESVTQFYSNALNNTKVKSLNLPNLKKISAQAFDSMRYLEEVNMPALKTIPNGLFEFCTSLKEIPEAVKNVTKINSAAFRHSGITEIDFPNATEVGYEAFSFFEKVKRVNLPEVVEFDMHRNLGSEELSEITLPKAISINCIESSPNLIEIHCPKLVNVSGTGFRDDTGLKVLDLPNLKTAEKGYLCSNCKSLEEVNLPNVTALGADSFRSCNALKEAYFPLCTKIGQDCFTDCPELEIIDLSSLKKIDVSYSPFEKCSKLKYIILNNLESMQYVQFYKCDNLKELSLPKLKSIKFEEPYFDYGDNGPKRVDVNMHMPVLETMQLVDYHFDSNELYHNAYVFPSTMKSVSLNKVPAEETSTLEFYYNTDFNINSCIIHNSHKSPIIFKDLPETAELKNGKNISLRAYCADPVYTWYYSENGADFEELYALNSNSILPDKSGYYYCKVAENGTELEAVSSTCKVSLDEEKELLTLNFNLDENVNFFAGDILYQNIESGKDIYLPSGTPIKLLYNGTFENIYINGDKVSQSPICFEFNLNENTEVTRREEKLIKNCTIKSNMPSEVTYTGEPIVPVYTVTYNGKELTENVDFTVDIVNNVNGNATASVLIAGIGEFSGSAIQTFKINPVNLNACKISIPEQEYTGSALKPAPVITYKGRTISGGYTLDYYDNTKIGTAYCFIEGDEKTLTGYKEVSFRIGVSIKNAEITFDSDEYLYTGSAVTPQPTVRIGSTPLKLNTDYTLAYADNINIGTATVTVKGKGKYVFDTSAQFNIVEKLTPKPEPSTEENTKQSSDSSTKPAEEKSSDKAIEASSTTSPSKTEKEKAKSAVKTPKATVVKKLKRGKRQITVTWKKVSGISGYQLQLATNKKFTKNKKTVNVKKAKTTSKAVKKLKARKKYYVRIRTYKTVNGKKYYSKWSKAKTVKTK